MNEPYPLLEARFGRMGRLRALAAIVNWDTATGMPIGSSEARAEETAAFEATLHDMLTDQRTADLLDAAEEADTGLDDWRRANLAEMRRAWAHATAVPVDLVEAVSRAGSRCEIAWRSARADNDFKGLLPLLSQVLNTQRALAQAKGEALGLAPYDALLDQYEPGGRDADVARLFTPLEAALPGLIDRVIALQAYEPTPLQPSGPFPIEVQGQVGRAFMTALGFDFNRGRLDTSSHPFCGGTPDDLRLTTRYREDDFRSALMGVLHETGHALYEAGLPVDWRYQPVGEARGMSIHESQSLLIEMQLCRSRPFMAFAAPRLASAFGGTGPAWEAENLYRLGTRVRRSLIRVDADEVTYPAHVILRWRIERALIAGDLALPDLPGAWADGMRELIGIVPPDDRDGCLQDIHWPSGAFGYFPTYTMGAMTAAQLYVAARAALPDLDGDVAAGRFAPLIGWLRTAVHAQGSRLSAGDLLAGATGRPLDAEAFLSHLEARYLCGR